MIEVVAAIIYFEKKVLCFQRGEGKYGYTSHKYEFPGGKIEPGEDRVQALKRELWEELEIQVVIKEKVISVEHSYPDFDILMHCYRCVTEEFHGRLKEHINFKLLRPEDLQSLEWMDADKPVVDLISAG